jgi:dipicolinate synthase subunit B
MPQSSTTRLLGVKIGAVLTGSHCTMGEVLPQIESLKHEGAEIYPIFSYTVDAVDNVFTKLKI